MGTYIRILSKSSIPAAKKSSLLYQIWTIYSSLCPNFSVIKNSQTWGYSAFEYSYIYKAINRLSPSCFHNFFQLNSTIHKIGTRQATRGDLFKSLKNTTLYGLRTIQYFGSKLWNTLPLFIRVANSVAVFWSKLKTHFLDTYWKLTHKIILVSRLNDLPNWFSSVYSGKSGKQFVLFLFYWIMLLFYYFYGGGGALSRLVNLFRGLLLNQSINIKYNHVKFLFCNL